VVSGGVNRRVTFWDAATGRVIRTLHFSDPVWWVAVSSDGKLLAVQTSPSDESSNRVAVVRLATGKLLLSHTLPNGPNGVVFSPDGRELFALGCCWAGSGSSLTAWDVHTWRVLFRLGSRVGAEAFGVAPDSRRLAVGTAGGALVTLDARSGKRIGPPIQAAGGEIAQISFSPDDHIVAVASDDQTASVWDLRTRSRVGSAFGPYHGTIPATLFTPDGHLLIGLEGSAIEWPMDAQTWERFACQAAGRDLTRTEWRDLLPGRPYESVCPQYG
jgi:WD40 repeat protein